MTLRHEHFFKTPLQLTVAGDANTLGLLNKISNQLERIERQQMKINDALALLTTSVDSLDTSIQEEIVQFEELKRQQGGTLSPDQEEALNALLERIAADKQALDATSVGS